MQVATLVKAFFSMDPMDRQMQREYEGMHVCMCINNNNSNDTNILSTSSANSLHSHGIAHM